MNKKIIRDELQYLLEAINEQFGILKEVEGKIPRIEYDILMDNIRKFYEDMRMLQRVDEPTAPAEKKTKTPDPAPVKTQVTPVPPREPSHDVTVRFEKPASEPGQQPSTRKEPTAPARKQSKPEEPDLFAEEEPVFNIRLKEAREKSLGPKPAPPSESLKGSITINDKFMLINDLFDGNLKEYNETIETLSGFKTLYQASEFLELMVKKNFWDTGSSAFQKLKTLLEQRF
jgi:hypothetical protein